MKKLLRSYSYLTLIVALLPVILFLVGNQTKYNSLVQEDGIVEYLTAISLLAVSLWVVYTALKYRKNKSVVWFISQLFIAAVFFFGFGEEISWGQRIFGIESNEFFLENNAQNETNFHNLVVGDTKINKVIFAQGLTILFGVYFLFSQVLVRNVGWIKKIFHQFSIPVPKYYHTILILLFTAPVLFLNASRKWELWELALVGILLMLFLDQREYSLHEN